MNNIDKEVRMLPPFKRLCMTIGELPSSYLESMTYYESLLWFTRYLKDTVIPAINGNAEAVKELQDKYIELKDYVDNYFDNLDIQTEIDTKLDEMAESGDLVTIIATFLGTNAVIGFDTKSALKGAENLSDGVIARTIGETTYNDGKGSFYKIRELVEGDVIDDDLLLELSNYPTLVAEKISDYRMDQVESDIDTINNTTIPAIEDEISSLADKKWLFVGDSYSQGSAAGGYQDGWSRLLKQKMDLTDDTCIIADHGGAGFANTSYPYSQILNDLSADDEITDILIAGGYNDTYYPSSQIENGMTNCKTIINTKFPNAKIHIGFIGGTTNTNRQYILRTINLYQDKCLELGIDYMPNLQYVLYDSSYFQEDGIHPNQYGQAAICNALYQALDRGYNYYRDINLTVDTSSSPHFSNSGTFTLRLRQVNNTSSLSLSSPITLDATEAFSATTSEFLQIGTIDQIGIIGSYTYSSLLNIGNVIVYSTTNPTGFYNVEAQLLISLNGVVWIKLMKRANETHDSYLSYGGLRSLQIDYFDVNYLTDIM